MIKGLGVCVAQTTVPLRIACTSYMVGMSGEWQHANVQVLLHVQLDD